MTAILAMVMACTCLASEKKALPKDKAGSVWLTSMEQAMAAAKKAERPILVDFTGSDWCGWCIRLKKEVFSTAQFRKWAGANVILVEVDFPRRKPQDAETKKRNRALATKYGIKGFPTILFIDAAGKELGRSGYMRGGPKVWTGNADKLLAGKGAGK